MPLSVHLDLREGDAEQHQLLEPELGAAVVAREARAPVPVRAVQRPDVRERDRPPLQVDDLPALWVVQGQGTSPEGSGFRVQG